jgi:hypothetical protein
MRETMNSVDVVPPLAANMSAAFKKVRGTIGAADPVLRDLIVTRIVELAKDGVYDIDELSSRTRNRVARRIRSGFYFGVPRLHSLPLPTSSGPCPSNGANQFPIARADPPGALVPAVSFFGGFRTPALAPVDRSALAGIRNPAQFLPPSLATAMEELASTADAKHTTAYKSF